MKLTEVFASKTYGEGEGRPFPHINLDDDNIDKYRDWIHDELRLTVLLSKKAITSIHIDDYVLFINDDRSEGFGNIIAFFYISDTGQLVLQVDESGKSEWWFTTKDKRWTKSRFLANARRHWKRELRR